MTTATTLTADQIAALPYRRCVGVVLANSEGRVFAGQRIDNPGPAWQMPQGGIDAGEKPKQAALRELREETGILPDSVEIVDRTRGWLSYDLPVDLVPRIWKGRYRGQEQRWFLMRFLGNDALVNIETEHPGIQPVGLDGTGRVARPDRSLQARNLSDGIRGLRQPLELRLRRASTQPGGTGPVSGARRSWPRQVRCHRPRHAIPVSAHRETCQIGKPVSSHFPAGFQPRKTTQFPWLAPHSPERTIFAAFPPKPSLGSGTRARWRDGLTRRRMSDRRHG